MSKRNEYHLIKGTKFVEKLSKVYESPLFVMHDAGIVQLQAYLAELDEKLKGDPYACFSEKIPNVVVGKPYESHEYTYVAVKNLEAEGIVPRRYWVHIIMRYNIDQQTHSVWIHDIMAQKFDQLVR